MGDSLDSAAIKQSHLSLGRPVAFVWGICVYFMIIIFFFYRAAKFLKPLRVFLFFVFNIIFLLLGDTSSSPGHFTLSLSSFPARVQFLYRLSLIFSQIARPLVAPAPPPICSSL